MRMDTHWSLLAGLLAGLAVLVAVPQRGDHRVAQVLRVGGERSSRVRRQLSWLERAWSKQARRSAQLDASQVATLAERVAALSRAGLPQPRLWRVLADREDAAAPACEVVARVVEMGGTSAEGLRLAGDRGEPLAWVGLACSVSQTCGAPLSEVLDGIAATVRAEVDAQRERESALAGARATATVLSWLPLAGIGLGLLTGENLVQVLVTTTPGRACLAVGVSFWVAGRAWMSWLIRHAERAGSAT
jgi:tight adherence protein B